MSSYLTFVERLRVAGIIERKPNNELVVKHAAMGRVEIDTLLCTGCKMCVKACPANALVMTGKKSVAMTGEDAGCIACGDCVAICRPAAIVITKPMVYEGLYKHIGRGTLEYPRRF